MANGLVMRIKYSKSTTTTAARYNAAALTQGSIYMPYGCGSQKKTRLQGRRASARRSGRSSHSVTVVRRLPAYRTSSVELFLFPLHQVLLHKVCSGLGCL